MVFSHLMSLRQEREPVALDRQAADRCFPSLTWIQRLMDMVCHSNARRIYIPSPVIGIEAVNGVDLLCRRGGEETECATGETKSTWQHRIDNDLPRRVSKCTTFRIRH
jgi:hypothetical protein